jgi:flagellar basal body rod protein FlgB
MQLRAPEANHISELLALLVAFTKTRRQVLANNINDMDVSGYSPQDLEIEEFSKAMNNAISEYLVHQRILLVDTDTIHFGPNMTLELESVSDGQAHALLLHDRQAYVEYQTKRLLENALNEKVALKLLKTKQLEPNTHQTPIENRLLY